MLDEMLIRRLFEDAVRRSGSVGAQLSIVKGGDQLDLAAGMADAERGVKLTPDTLIQIGSITKVFNAAIVVALADEGLLDLDAPITAYLPALHIANQSALQQMTLRHLLSMSAGLDNGLYHYFGAEDDALARYINQLEGLPQHFKPGEYFGYSNAGICIAGYIASRVTGKPWETLLKEKILHPAALSRSAILDEDLPGKTIAVGHTVPRGGDQLKVVQPKLSAFRARAPSGPSFALATADLARFAKIFLNNGIADVGARVLSEACVARMMTPQVQTQTRKYGSAWCMGPCTGTWSGAKVFGHGGTTATSSSYLYWIPERGVAIAFIVNTVEAMGEFSRIVFEEIVPAAFGLSRPRIDAPEGPSGAPNLDRYIGTYAELGTKMEVLRGEGETLVARWIPTPSAAEQGVARKVQTATLTWLGNDRFLVHPAGGPDPHRGVIDAAFFGKDNSGRATNVLNLVFPMSRLDN